MARYSPHSDILPLLYPPPCTLQDVHKVALRHNTLQDVHKPTISGLFETRKITPCQLETRTWLVQCSDPSKMKVSS
eukprot:552129-Pleurochrysis_carterae.AAC.3